MNWLPIIEYRDFWDVPRIFFVRKNGVLLLFDCEFNDQKEDYSDEYKVYIMPELPAGESWKGIFERATEYLGNVPVDKVNFDETRRKFIQDDLAFLIPLTPADKPRV